jgi:hypothetical protein
VVLNPGYALESAQELKKNFKCPDITFKDMDLIVLR